MGDFGAVGAATLILLLALTSGQGTDAARNANAAKSKTETVPIPTFEVPTVSFADLIDPAAFAASTADDVLRLAMLGDGVLSVSGVPGFGRLRREVMAGAALCGQIAPTARTTIFADGTARRTFASTTKGFDDHSAIDFVGAGIGSKVSNVGDDVNVDGGACSDAFKTRTNEFRAAVSAVTEHFTKRLSEVFPTRGGMPLLWNVPHDKSYATMEEVARGAEHLEHFHAYHRPALVAAATDAAATADKTADKTADETDDATEDASTIDLHADQGLFIAFTPGLIVQTIMSAGGRATVEEVVTAEGAAAPAGTFYVQRRDGTRARCEFGFDGDVIVLMLGDGVDSIVNPKMPEGVELRATPHGLSMPEGLIPSQARMWYGRMFLPPAEALSEEHGISYAALRTKVIEQVHSGDGVGGGVGCSRMLLETEGTQCADNQIFCWMRCMNHTPAANPTACAANDGGNSPLKLQCASQRGQVWRKGFDSHGDYNPTCTNSTENITADPIMPALYTRLTDGTCTNASFADFLNKTSYPNSHELVKDKLYMQWRLAVDGKAVEVRMAYDGVVGYLSVGPENVGGKRGGMQGSKVVMGIFDPDANIYSGAAWHNYIGPTGVSEHVIHATQSSFRHWKQAHNVTSLIDSSMAVTRCHSHMTFKTAIVAGAALNMTAGSSNALIWGVHTGGLLKGYHGRTGRGHLRVDFSKDVGHVALAVPSLPPIAPGPAHVHAPAPPPATAPVGQASSAAMVSPVAIYSVGAAAILAVQALF